MASTSPATAQEYLELPGLQTLSSGGSTWRVGALAGLLLASVLSVGIIFLEISARDKRTEIVRNTELRLKISANGRAEVLSEWLNGRLALAEPISQSDLFLLFATEIDLAGTESVPKGALADQLPYMQSALAEFARQADLAGAYLLNREGRAYIASPAAPALSAEQRTSARALFPTGTPTVTPLRADGDGLRLDILVPLQPPQASSAAAAERTVGVLLMTLAADARLAEILAPGRFLEELLERPRRR